MSKIPDHSEEYYELDWECEELGITLHCYFDYEPESRGTREFPSGLQLEPDYPATFSLVHAYTPDGLDISPVMRFELLTEIEKWAAEEFQREWDEEVTAAAYDRWLAEQEMKSRYPEDF